jgi:hypothetical protein
MRAIPLGPEASIGDFRRYPGCRLALTCAMCGWTKGYNPERIIARLHELKAGGHATPLRTVAKRVQWPCPGCGRLRWRAGLAWPADFDAREARRLANLYRN